MKLLHIARGHVMVAVDERTLHIEGEGLLRPPGPEHPHHVDYVIYTNTLSNWDAPWDKSPLSEKVKVEIIQFLKKEFITRKMNLVVE